MGGYRYYGKRVVDEYEEAIMPQCIVVVFSIVWSVCAAAGDLNGQSTTASTLGIKVSPEGVLLKDGQPFRAVGVNCFDCFYNSLIDANDTSYMQAFEVLKCHNIQFVRFSLSGFYPIHFQLYFQNKPEFYRRLDAMVQSAEQNGIGLMPSFFWTKFCISDIFGEHINKWGDTNSQTRQFMRSFTTEVVLRYKDSPAIWGWEFGNEDSLGCDLPNAAEWRPFVDPNYGTPAYRTAEDDLTSDILHSALTDFAQTIRAVDPSRVISSGNAFMRPSQWHQYTYNSWDTDTPAQTKEMIDYLNPDPVDIISVHA